MTTCLRYPKGYQFFDSNGAPLSLAALSYFQAGTTTLQDTYLDAAGTITNANPIVFDGSGRLLVDVYLGSAANYKEVLTTPDGAIVSPWPADNIPCASAASSGGNGTDLSVTRAATTVTVQSSTGAAATLVSADSTYAGVLTTSDKQKLDGIAVGAQVQPTAAQIVSSIDTQIGATTWRVAMAAATSSAAGAAGWVPAPAAGQQVSFLRGDGTWQTLAGSGGGTPGGSTGQLQWNSGGSLAGLTITGDATLNTSTGALTVTQTNGVAFATVATSGSYGDLSNTPTIPAAQVNSDWNAASSRLGRGWWSRSSP